MSNLLGPLPLVLSWIQSLLTCRLKAGKKEREQVEKKIVEVRELGEDPENDVYGRTIPLPSFFFFCHCSNSIAIKVT